MMWSTSSVGMQSALEWDMTSPDSRSDDRASDLQRWYSGYLIVKNLPSNVTREVAELAKEIPFLNATQTAIDVEYKGRDSSRVVVRALLRLARLIQNADGEVRCEVSGNTDQLWFEFFTVRDGRLYRQRGSVTRESEKEVTDRTL